MTPARMESGRLLRLGGATVAGALMALAFPPAGWWPLAAVAVALLTAAVAGVRVRWALLLGLLAGIVFFGVLLRWVAVVGWDAWLALTLYSGAWLALTGMLTALAMRLPGWVLWVPVVWVAQEALRGRVPLGGWPWGRLGFSQSEAPELPLASLGGVPLLTFAVALAGVALVWVVRNARRTPVVAGAGLVAVLVTPWLLTAIPTPVTGEVAAVGVVQGDVPATGLGFAVTRQRRTVLDNHARQTERLAAAASRGEVPQPQAVVWPENASDLDPYAEPDAAAVITAAATRVGVPILVGAVVANPDDPTTVLNVGIVWDPVTGPGDRYVKVHPVPFGEYVPFRALLANRIDRFALIPRDYAAGDRVGVLRLGDLTIGDVICFEIAYDEIVRDTVQAGARMLTVQTNNATYTGHGQTEQQLAMARIRAVEHGRSVVVAATNGISAAFGPDGTEVGRIGESRAGFLVPELPQRDALSLADRVAWWPELGAVLIATTVAVLGLRRPPRVARRVATEGPGVAAGEGRDSMEG